MFRWLMVVSVILAATSAVAEPAPLAAYMGQARHQPQAVIHYGPAPAQVAEVFLPKGKGPYPVVVLLHGGCWLKEYEGLAQTSAIAADLAARGYAVWNVDYRKLGEAGAGYPGTFLDVATAVDGLRDQAATYHLDLSRVVAIGHSAGGHLALWAASRTKLPSDSPLRRPNPLPIGAVISLAGIGDLQGDAKVWGIACGDDTIPRIVDQAGRKMPFADTSPAELLPVGVKVVMVHGAYDAIMPPHTGLGYVQKVRKAGDPAEVVTIPDAGHFDVVIPTTPAWRQVVAILDREMKALPHRK